VRPKQQDSSKSIKALKVFMVFMVVLAIAAFIASRITVSSYAIVPGNAFSVEQLIKLPKKYSYAHQASVDMVDVQLIQLNALEYPYYAWFDSNDQLYSTQQITGSATSAQYQEQGVIDMDNAQQAATYVALKQMGYNITAKASGVIVYQSQPGSPVNRYLADNDVISAINGRKVTTFASIGPALGKKIPNSTVAITVHKFGQNKEREVTFHLGAYRAVPDGKRSYLYCFPVGAGKQYPLYTLNKKDVGCLGLLYAPYLGGSEPYYKLSKLPFKIDLSAEGIIGPSAGLAFTLGLLDRLDGGSLTDGRKIAATGTMSINGAVGPIGGIKEKTIAVENAGDSIFFVPQSNKASAESRNNGHLKIIGVTNIHQVIAYLEKIGGKLHAIQARKAHRS